METIKSIFDTAMKDVSFDKNLAKQIGKLEKKFVNKNSDHIAFFGGNLTGVNPIRFTTTDRNSLLIDVFDIDERLISMEIKSIPEIGDNWVRGTDVVNLSCLYMVHRYYNSNLPARDKHNAMIEALLFLQYKLLTSIMQHNFKHPANEGLARATYAELSGKFTIKQHGTWYKVLLSRAEDILRPNGIHLKAIKDFGDADVQNMITDIQNRLKSMIKYINDVFYRLRDQKATILSTDSKIELDGKMTLRDIERVQDKYSRYLNSIVLSKDEFIKRELIDIVCSTMNDLPGKLIYETLMFIHEGAVDDKKKVNLVLTEILLHFFSSVKDDRQLYNRMNDIPALLVRFKSLYMASRSRDPSVLILRTEVEKMVIEATKVKTKSTVSSVRTGVLLYLILRTLTMKHYSS